MKYRYLIIDEYSSCYGTNDFLVAKVAYDDQEMDVIDCATGRVLSGLSPTEWDEIKDFTV